MTEARAQIAAMRAAIDEVDHALIELCARRRLIVTGLLAVKRELGLPLLDPAREADLIADRRAFAERSGVPADVAERLFRVLLDASHDQIADPTGHAEAR